MKKYLVYTAVGFIMGLVLMIGDAMITGNLWLPGLSVLTPLFPGTASLGFAFLIINSFLIGLILSFFYWILLLIKKIKTKPSNLFLAFLFFSLGSAMVYIIYLFLIIMAFVNWKGPSFPD